MNITTAPNDDTAAPLALYTVMIPWHAGQSELGTYESSVWAPSAKAAELAIAREMAAHRDSGCESEDEEDAFASDLVSSKLSVINLVQNTVKSDIETLLAGPSGTLDEVAKQKLATILDLLDIRSPE